MRYIIYTIYNNSNLINEVYTKPTYNILFQKPLNCTSKWTTLNGVKGIILTSRKNGNSIFLPFAGYGENDTLSDVGSIGYYWTSTFMDDHALYGMFYSGGASKSRLHQGNGFSVRPVIK